MTLKEFIDKIYPMLLRHELDRVDKELAEGKISAYWIGSIIRLDIKSIMK